MSATIDLDGTQLFHQGMPEQVTNWLTENVGIIYHKDEIWRHNEKIFNQPLQSVQLLGTMLSSIQAELEYPHECIIMTVVHACGWNFTRKRKLATCTESLQIKQSKNSLLRIEDDAQALKFSLKWM